MEKFMYISILLFINAVFFFQLTNCVNRKQNSTNKLTKGKKGNDYFFRFGSTCNIHTDAKCADACDRTFIINGRGVRCCQGGGDRGLWTNICRDGGCEPHEGYVWKYFECGHFSLIGTTCIFFNFVIVIDAVGCRAVVILTQITNGQITVEVICPCIIQGDLQGHALVAHWRPAFRPAHPRSEGSNCARPSAIGGAARNDIM